MYSVIIPAKNEIPHLWYTVHMIRQMWEHHPDEGGEIIVIDDGSTDFTQTFLNDWVIKGFVKSIRTEGVSGPRARQLGAEAARGDVLFFFDAHILVAHDFFNKALHTIRNRIWDTVGTVHYPICWNGILMNHAATHYVLTLEKNFWGVNAVGNFKELTETAGSGHGCFACRRDRFLEVGGYRAPFVEYGGEETYLNLKMRMWGYRNYCDPGVYYLHCSTRNQAYHWSNDTFFRNMAMTAYILGDKDWSDKVYESHRGPGANPDVLARLYEDAVTSGEEERQWVRQNARLTLDEVLADLKARGVPH
ncbi:MAG TPA: glycosyltransferase family 2 protein [Symbiobacteriaceae bacterium]|nr:glycosyltransferase family 2 protein [Symbiobacteriaceae bacterium]